MPKIFTADMFDEEPASPAPKPKAPPEGRARPSVARPTPKPRPLPPVDRGPSLLSRRPEDDQEVKYEPIEDSPLGPRERDPIDQLEPPKLPEGMMLYPDERLRICPKCFKWGIHQPRCPTRGHPGPWYSVSHDVRGRLHGYLEIIASYHCEIDGDMP